MAQQSEQYARGRESGVRIIGVGAALGQIADRRNMSWLAMASISLVAIALAIFVFRAMGYAGYLAEDAYISFRFATNLADGHGLVWNIGGERVEGYTSPLHIFLLALSMKIGLSAPFAAILISYLSLAGIIGIYVLILRREVGKFTLIGAILLFVFLVDERLAVHTMAGLDTVMYMFLLAASFATSYFFISSPSRLSAASLGTVNLLALLGRPDAAPFIVGQAVVILAYSVYIYLKRGQSNYLVYAILAYGLTAGVGVVYMAWKFYYFGYLLPNPFYIKSNDFLTLNGLGSVIWHGANLGLRYAVIVIPALVFLDRSRIMAWLKPPAARAKLALWLIPSGGFLLYYITVIPEVNYLNRFEYPSYFILLTGLAIFLSMGNPIQNMYSKISPILGSRASKATIAIASVIIFVFVVRVNGIFFPWFQIVEDSYYRPIAESLERTKLGPEASIVFDSAGVVPYISGFTHIDPVGLTDNVLSGREPITVLEREQYIWGKNPDIYIGAEPPASPGATGWSDDSIIQTSFVQEVFLAADRYKINRQYSSAYGDLSEEARREALHFRMRELRDNWSFIGEVPYPVPQPAQFTTFAYVRKDSPHFQQLVDALEPVIFRRPDEIDFDPAIEADSEAPATFPSRVIRYAKCQFLNVACAAFLENIINTDAYGYRDNG